MYEVLIPVMDKCFFFYQNVILFKNYVDVIFQITLKVKLANTCIYLVSIRRFISFNETTGRGFVLKNIFTNVIYFILLEHVMIQKKKKFYS